MIKIRQLIPLLLATLLFAGCTSVPDSITSVEWQSHQQKLASIDNYLVTGKLGYISPEQRESLNFQWRHSAAQSQLRLTTFLGQTVLNLSISPQGARVETYDAQVFTDPSADALVYRLTGLVIPVEQLQNWLLGNPTNADHYLLNDTNTLASLEKQVSWQNWHLDYLSYRDEPLSQQIVPLPSKMKLKQGDTTLNIVVSKWVLNQ